MKKQTYKELLEVTRVGNRAVRKAQEENRAKGLPNVYARHKKLYFELPDGTIITKNPL